VSGLLSVRVTPRAARDEIAGWQGDVLRVRVMVAPADGLANRAVADLLAAAARVPRSSVALVRGARARDKVFRVANLSLADLRARVASPAALAPRPAPAGGGPEREGHPKPGRHGR
jgi:uncharacterized protein YggU (UPF0235/DUF167 family)